METNQTTPVNSSSTNHAEDKKISPEFDYTGFTKDDFKAEGDSLASDPLDSIVSSCRVDLNEPLQPAPIAMYIRSVGEFIPLFTKGNFSIVTGAAKSRKSFFLSMLMLAAIKGAFGILSCPSVGVNILFDTEQSKYKVQQIGKRIQRLLGSKSTENFIIYSLRTLEPSQRLALIERVLSTTPNINFVAIDGIVDLSIDPILQADQATQIVSKLMQWTENYNIHIACVLQYNKTVQTLLGHLGSFSHRKADAVIQVAKNTDDNSVSLVEAVDCREKEFEPFAFSVDESGNPYIIEDYQYVKKRSDRKHEKNKPFLPSDLNSKQHIAIIDEVFRVNQSQQRGELVPTIKASLKSILSKEVGESKIRDFVTYYLQNEMIRKVEPPKGYSYYVKVSFDDLDNKDRVDTDFK